MRLAVIGKYTSNNSIGKCSGYRVIDIDSLEIRDITQEQAYNAYIDNKVSIKGLNYTNKGVYIKSKSVISNIDKLEDINSATGNVYIYIKDDGNKSILVTCTKNIIKIDNENINKFLENNIVIPLNYSGTNINTIIRNSIIIESNNFRLITSKYRKLVAIGVNRQNNNINNKALMYKLYDIANEEYLCVNTEDVKCLISKGYNIKWLVYTLGTIKLDSHSCCGDRLPLIDSEGNSINKYEANIYIPIYIDEKKLKIINCDGNILSIDVKQYKNYNIIGTNKSTTLNKIYNKLNSKNEIRINTYRQSLYDWCKNNGEYGEDLLEEYIGDIDIHCIPHSSKKVVNWKCPYGHEYELSPARRTSKYKRGCIICSKMQSGTSFAEQFYLQSLRQIYKDVKHRVLIDKSEFDVYIPINKIAIEYNADYWHIGKTDNDFKKECIANKNNIRLIKIVADRTEKDIKVINNTIITKPEQSLNDFKHVLYELCKMIGCEMNSINIEDAYNKAFKSKNISNMNISDSMSELYKNTVNTLFIDKNEAKYLKIGSNKEIKLKCPICNAEWTSTPNIITRDTHRNNNKRKYDNDVKCKYCGKTTIQIISELQL